MMIKLLKRFWRRIKIEMIWFFDQRILDAINAGAEQFEVVQLAEDIADGRDNPLLHNHNDHIGEMPAPDKFLAVCGVIICALAILTIVIIVC